ncbi:ABC transporter permease [Pseudohalocynthiibacter aestuariivivens]|jgi:spermidine/putrescine transport system permease protein|uniref:Spermidine/putrescine transport system permease protein PotC n=1 Tax=Pseudohalocynthiibacter aestuariivivens TaxID=1591409 RepID=A0ABV5JED1_9RHOB|nr:MULTISPECIES: ABC transporter permease [Pseudohalocynthiibacter]MBS9719032.1 ABC transporter permease [Pseudohalocynthiibacter aestuariivivens]MCK0104108.1 ABC transporter permease [Pseudohalocynthiibacter sp. F2068]
MAKRYDLRRQPGFSQIAWFCIFMLYAPILMLVLFSFNDNRSVVKWTEFSFRWYTEAFANDGIRAAAVTSLKLALVASVFGTIFATMAALATTRTRPYRGMNLAYAIINQPLMIPEIVTAIASLSLFALIKQITGVTGIGYLMLAHTVFCVPFAYMPIRARLEDMTLTLEQAAADLYASPIRVFWEVTFPLLIPGVVSGAMLAFVVSLDDVIITLMVAGPGETTLPIFILGAIRRGITPEINAVSTILLAVSILLVAVFFLFQRKTKK